MRTSVNDKNTTSALFGQVRRAILALLFTHSDDSYYVRQIARIAGSGLGAVHRELNNLVKAGLVIRTDRGKQVYYQANRKSPVFDEIRGLMVKTAGVADVIRGALAPMSDGIELAFIYGSFARGDEDASSDVDVMVVGDVSFGEIVTALTPAENQLRREINPTVFAASEFKERLERGEHFISSVMSAPKIMLIGEDSDTGTVV